LIKCQSIKNVIYQIEFVARSTSEISFFETSEIISQLTNVGSS